QLISDADFESFDQLHYEGENKRLARITSIEAKRGTGGWQDSLPAHPGVHQSSNPPIHTFHECTRHPSTPGRHRYSLRPPAPALRVASGRRKCTTCTTSPPSVSYPRNTSISPPSWKPSSACCAATRASSRQFPNWLIATWSR